MHIENFEDKKFYSAVLEGVQIMCRVFWGPDSASCRQMMESNFFQPFEIIFRKSVKIRSEEKPAVILDNINSIINGFEYHSSFYHHLNECYVRLFVNCKAGIMTPLYQSCYEFENAPMMGESAIKMEKRFLSKGLSMENRVQEPPDHLAIELEYLFFLLQEEGLDPDENPDHFISDEAASFAGETMLPWVIIFNQRLQSANAGCAFYSLFSGILVLFLKRIASRE